MTIKTIQFYDYSTGEFMPVSRLSELRQKVDSESGIGLVECRAVGEYGLKDRTVSFVITRAFVLNSPAHLLNDYINRVIEKLLSKPRREEKNHEEK